MSILDIFKNKNSLNKIKNQIDLTNLPIHIAIIMDGNGRWAKKFNLPRNLGHREGINSLKRIVIILNDLGIKYLTVYAFSTENWNRPKKEIEGLLKLLSEFLDSFEKEFGNLNVKIKHIGDLSALSENIVAKIKKVEDKTKDNTGLCLNVAFNYGAKNEIINAVKLIANDIKLDKLKVEDINEKLFEKKLYTADLPDPELIIRTSGEFRLSNFLLWQSSYSELYFDNTLWPEYKEKNIIEALTTYQKRKRRFGGI